MAPNFDLGVGSLLCAEDNCIFDNNDDDDETLEEEFVLPPYYLRTNGTRSRRNRTPCGGCGDGERFPFVSDECLTGMVEKETHHVPVDGYLSKLQNGELDVGARRDAVDWIGKVGVSLIAFSILISIFISMADF